MEKHSFPWGGRTWLSFGVTTGGDHAFSYRIEGCAMGVLLFPLPTGYCVWGWQLCPLLVSIS